MRVTNRTRKSSTVREESIECIGLELVLDAFDCLPLYRMQPHCPYTPRLGSVCSHSLFVMALDDSPLEDYILSYSGKTSQMR